MSKNPLSDDQRQAFLDTLPEDQKQENPEQVFDDTIARAVQPTQLKQQTPDSSDGYSDTQTHSDTTEGTSH